MIVISSNNLCIHRLQQNAALHKATYSFELSHAGKEKRQSRMGIRMMIDIYKYISSKPNLISMNAS